jgi:glycosyltransferase involved in cell wall biosynthesis
VKILHIITTIDRGGAENHLLSLIRGQIKYYNHEVDLVYLKGDGGLRKELYEIGVKNIYKLDFSLKGIRNLYKIVKTNNYNIVHSHLLKANLIGGISSKIANISHIASKHNDEHQLRKNKLYKFIHKKVSDLCDDQIICLSNHVKNYMINMRLDENKMNVIYYSFDKDLYFVKSGFNIFKEFNIPENSFIFGIIARITEQKGHKYLISAFKKHLEKHPNSVLLVVGGIGYNDKYLMEVKKIIKELKIDDKVIFTGKRDDAYTIMSQLDVFIMPSLWEGFGMVFLEAGSLEIPIISTKVSAIPEVVSENGGILVDVNNLENNLVIAMNEMKENYILYKNRSKKFRIEILNKFDHKRMVDETIGVYKKALKSNKL